eukprot:TRINITY_DN30382_c1_g1_i1.p4 TRINITY_DN30382_c1_g1~~TRINITY_DN30382_c1_g1_i1.p4  ORF type:complete len:128 (-),score=2.09 TRINITY_DN30382_c1_g1_i1:72-455(-)
MQLEQNIFFIYKYIVINNFFCLRQDQMLLVLFCINKKFLNFQLQYLKSLIFIDIEVSIKKCTFSFFFRVFQQVILKKIYLQCWVIYLYILKIQQINIQNFNVICVEFNSIKVVIIFDTFAFKKKKRQ